MATKRQFQSEALQYTHDKFIGDDPEQNATMNRISLASKLQSGFTSADKGRIEPEAVGKTGRHHRICNLPP